VTNSRTFFCPLLPHAFSATGGILRPNSEVLHAIALVENSPITREGRLRLMDDFSQSVLDLPENEAVRLLDIGCGYPPPTTMETANRYPNWNCIGIDPNLPEPFF